MSQRSMMCWDGSLGKQQGIFLLLLGLIGSGLSTDRLRGEDSPADPYDVLYDVIMSRRGPDGESYGADESFPTIFQTSSFPFGDQTYPRLDAALDAFGALSQAKIDAYSDVRRAWLQRHLWHVFDATAPYRWTSRDPVTGEPRQVVRNKRHSSRREAVRPKIASLIQRLALTRTQILGLPDTRAATLESGAYSPRHDPEDPLKPFLPADLGLEGGSWVCIGFDGEPPAPVHSKKIQFRSAFLTFIRLPQGPSETLQYLQRTSGRRGDPEQFPVGTQFAFIEQAFLISDEGEIVLSPLVISISLRAYLNVDRTPRKLGRPTQALAEFVAQPRQLMQGDAVMRALGPGDLRLEAGDVDIHGDMIEPIEKSDGYQRARRRNDMLRVSRLNLCMTCHSQPGIDGVGGGAGLFGVKQRGQQKLVQASLSYKRDDDTWKTLRSFWREESAGSQPP